MKTYTLVSARFLSSLKFFIPVSLVILLCVPAQVCSGAPQTNTVPWSDNFENYTNQTPLIDGTNGWWASSVDCIVQQGVTNSGLQAAMLPVDVTLSNRFIPQSRLNVSLVFYMQPQLYNGTNYPVISSNVAAQFFVSTNGYFVVGNGSAWNEATTLASGGSAIRITNNYFTRVQVHLQYNSHTWALKAWSNNTLVANASSLHFTSNINAFSGFDIYNGNSTSYVDDVSVVRWRGPFKVNGVYYDNINRMNGAVPGDKIDGAIPY